MSLIQESDGSYYVSFVVETKTTQSPTPNAYAVGVDMGLKDLAITVNSNGESCISDDIMKADRGELVEMLENTEEELLGRDWGQ